MTQLRTGQDSMAEGKDEVDSEWHSFFYDEDDLRKNTEEEIRRENKKDNEYSYKEEEQGERDESRQEDESLKPGILQNNNLPHDKKSKRRAKIKPGKVHKTNVTKPPTHDLDLDHAAKKHRGSLQSLDIMSDQENMRRQGRKLFRRGQMRKFRSMETDVEKAGKDRLEQKFQELQELITKPLADSRGLHLPQPQLKNVAVKKINARHGYERGNAVLEEENEDSQAYTTIRKLQMVGPETHLHFTNQKNHRPQTSSAQHRKLVSQPRPRRDSFDSLPTSSSGTEISPHETKENHKGSTSSLDHHHDSREEGHRREKLDNKVHPPSVHAPSDMHLKNSDNPKLLEWLRHKNAEFRQQKKAERAKRREERETNMLETERKQARRTKSEEQVKEWMEMKRKEAAERGKEERKRKKLLAQQVAEQKNSRNTSSSLTIHRIDRPASASPPPATKKYIPIKRPESAHVKLDSEAAVPKPPDSKFVYRRPVSGHLRLMKLQRARNSHEANQQRNETLSPEEKLKRARMSYDAWLIAKRKEDIQKRKEAGKQKELIKSDPEMERIIPEIARKRIERIRNGKQHIDTGIKKIDQHANKVFGDGDLEEEDGIPSADGDNVPNPSSYKLCIEGSAASLVEVTNRSRPVSAKTRMPIPQSLFSPRRTKSATPKVDAIMNQTEEAKANPFKLPFPEEHGAPEHVLRVQEKLFSQKLIEAQSKDWCPEPQICPVADGTRAPGPNKESTPRTSMTLLQQIEAAAQEQDEAETKKDTKQTDPLKTLPAIFFQNTQDCDGKEYIQSASSTNTIYEKAKIKSENRQGEEAKKTHFSADCTDDVADNSRHQDLGKAAEDAPSEKLQQTFNLLPDATTRLPCERELEETIPLMSVTLEEKKLDADQGQSRDEDALHKLLSKHVSFSEEATVHEMKESAESETSENEQEENECEDEF